MPSITRIFSGARKYGLGLGKTIARIGSSSNDFNLSTFPLVEVENNAGINKDFITYIVWKLKSKILSYTILLEIMIAINLKRENNILSIW